MVIDENLLALTNTAASLLTLIGVITILLRLIFNSWIIVGVYLVCAFFGICFSIGAYFLYDYSPLLSIVSGALGGGLIIALIYGVAQVTSSE